MFSRFKKYLDYAAITPINRGVLKLMNRVLRHHFHNPDSLYTKGVEATKIIDKSRLSIAKILNCHSDEIIFTSGGTESNNIAIQGVIDKWYQDHDYDYATQIKPHVIISEIEHPAVRNVIENLSKKKLITYSKIKVDHEGIIDLKNFKEILIENKNTILISIILVNNEIGVIQPIKEINSILRKHKENNYPLIHVDACQAINYLDINLDKLGVDLLSLDAGKFYGPHSSGVLYVKRNTLINPIFFGGAQEFGLRPGTLNIANIVGTAKALEIVKSKQKKEIERLTKMQKYIFDEISKMNNVSINGNLENRIVNNINICFKNKDAEFLLFKLDKLGFEVSTGTTCQNKKEDSRSLSVDALGNDCGGSSLRVSLGVYTSWRDVRGLVEVLRGIVG